MHALDKLSLERIQAEETLCRQRISQRLDCERIYAENRVRADLQNWIDLRLHKAPSGSVSGSSRHLSIENCTDSSAKVSSSTAAPNYRNRELEVQSVDSEVYANYSVTDSTAAVSNQGGYQNKSASVNCKLTHSIKGLRNPYLSASCENLITCPRTISPDNSYEKSFEYALNDRRIMSHDCNLDRAVVSQLQNFSFGEVHAV